MNNSFDQTTSQDATPEENKKVSWEEKYGKKKGGKKGKKEEGGGGKRKEGKTFLTRLPQPL